MDWANSVMAGILISSLTICACLLAWPIESNGSTGTEHNRISQDSKTPFESKDSMPSGELNSEYSGIVWGKVLRKYAAKHTPVEQAAKETAKSTSTVGSFQSKVRLVGTIYEPGHSFAAFQDEAGNVELRPEGGSLKVPQGSIQITKVSRNSVECLFDGKSHRLFIEQRKEPLSGSAIKTRDDEKIERQYVDSDFQGNEEVKNFETIDEELDWLNGEDDWEEDE